MRVTAEANGVKLSVEVDDSEQRKRPTAADLRAMAQGWIRDHNKNCALYLSASGTDSLQDSFFAFLAEQKPTGE